jgi:hypothetical protein
LTVAVNLRSEKYSLGVPPIQFYNKLECCIRIWIFCCFLHCLVFGRILFSADLFFLCFQQIFNVRQTKMVFQIVPWKITPFTIRILSMPTFRAWSYALIHFLRCSMIALLNSTRWSICSAIPLTRCSVYTLFHSCASSFAHCSIYAPVHSRAVPFSRWFHLRAVPFTRWIIHAQVHFRACQFTRWFVYARWSIDALIHVRAGLLTRCVINALVH